MKTSSPPRSRLLGLMVVGNLPQMSLKLSFSNKVSFIKLLVLTLLNKMVLWRGNTSISLKPQSHFCHSLHYLFLASLMLCKHLLLWLIYSLLLFLIFNILVTNCIPHHLTLHNWKFLVVHAILISNHTLVINLNLEPRSASF